MWPKTPEKLEDLGGGLALPNDAEDHAQNGAPGQAQGPCVVLRIGTMVSP